MQNIKVTDTDIKKINQEIGKKYNSLTIKEFSHKNGHLYFYCLCDCGKMTIATLQHLKTNHTKSCGCLHKKMFNGYKHHLNNTHIYKIWQGIKRRCLNKNELNYKDYGGRGIKICDEWKNNPVNFYNWAMSNGYKENLSIDRINVNGNYEPSNCRWATFKEQARNRRNTIYLEYNNEIKSLPEMAEKYKLTYACLYERLRKGWEIKKALTTPARIR